MRAAVDGGCQSGRDIAQSVVLLVAEAQSPSRPFEIEGGSGAFRLASVQAIVAGGTGLGFRQQVVAGTLADSG
jgi:hypothetical protein